MLTCAVRILAKGILDVETGELEEANLEETYPCSETIWSDIIISDFIKIAFS